MINIKSFGRLSSMFVRNRWEIIYILPSKQGWENGAFWRLRGVIHDWEGGGKGVGGFAVSFFMIMSKIVAPWGITIV